MANNAGGEGITLGRLVSTRDRAGIRRHGVDVTEETPPPNHVGRDTDRAFRRACSGDRP
jgi:hypothetical protein